MLGVFKRASLWTAAILATAGVVFGGLIAWPAPLFAFSLGTGKIVVYSDHPIPSAGGERFLRACEKLLERSPLQPTASQYRVYVANERWRQRVFFLPSPDAWGVAYTLFGSNVFLSGANFETGRVVHWGYVGTPPRTLAYLCAHELTHIITAEHIRLALLHVPAWVFEGFADYVGIEKRESFAQLHQMLGDRPVDIPMMIGYGSYPRYRLLVTFFIEKKGWTVDQLLNTKLTEDEATEIMRSDASR